jgi:hypothetical protein
MRGSGQDMSEENQTVEEISETKILPEADQVLVSSALPVLKSPSKESSM